MLPIKDLPYDLAISQATYSIFNRRRIYHCNIKELTLGPFCSDQVLLFKAIPVLKGKIPSAQYWFQTKD